MLKFTNQKDCIFVVYPAGTAGDLLASVVAQHYKNTNAKFFGIDHKGRVEFKSSDNKLANLYAHLDQRSNFEKIIEGVNTSLLNDNMLNDNSTVIISCHHHSKESVTAMLEYFTACKIIRIYLESPDESALAMWMSAYKNFDVWNDTPIPQDISSDEKYINILNERLLQIKFRDIINSSAFDTYYKDLIEFLNLSDRSVTKQFIEAWFDKQHDQAKEKIVSITNNKTGTANEEI